jgi:hypothetical protein
LSRLLRFFFLEPHEHPGSLGGMTGIEVELFGFYRPIT